MSEVIPETDEDDIDDEENKNEMSQIHAFSPRTRRSITGRRSIRLPIEDDSFEFEDDDEILSNGHDTNSKDSSDYKSIETPIDINSSDEFIGAQAFKRNRSVVPNNSTLIKTPNPKRFSQNLSSSTPSRSTPDIEFSDKSSDSHTSGIQIQSIQSSHSEYMKSIIQDDDSIVFLNSSDEENSAPNVDFKNIAGTSTPGVKLIQPKLQFGRNVGNSTNFVSREFYNQKEEALAQLRQELKDNEELMQKLGGTLPDKGANLKRRIADLKKQVQLKEDDLKLYAVEEDHLNHVDLTESKPKVTSQINNNWRDDLETIQPIYTGKQGMATFNTQKTLTLNRIEKLHKALEKCPTENELAKQPDHLNIQLMPHQLHAIKWMRWRENKRPKGGILADDMGLGKTLTVIGLVLASKYGNDQSTNEDIENDDSESDEDNDDEIERGTQKAYKNQGNFPLRYVI